jgi:phosphoadenosine phosphosulfate reductase
MKPSLAEVLAPRLAPLDLDHRLLLVREFIPGRIVFTTSFGLEDQLIAHSIFTQGLDVDVATIDTGRLFPETYALWERTEARYARRIRAVYPQAAPLEALIEEQGINGFYKSVEARKACCHVRKVEPLSRLLAGVSGWVTGLRADQSDARADAPLMRSFRCRSTIFTPKASSPSAARPARAPYSPARMSARAAGGGKKTRRKNVACMSAKTACYGADPRRKR